MADIKAIKINNILYDIKDNTARQTLNDKVDKVNGKGLSTNDFTTEEKNKLARINENIDSALSNTSENPVQNKVITAVLDEKATYEEMATHAPGYQNAYAGLYNGYPTFAVESNNIIITIPKSRHGRAFWTGGRTSDANATETRTFIVPVGSYFVYDTLARDYAVRLYAELLATDVICFWNSSNGKMIGQWVSYLALQEAADNTAKEEASAIRNLEYIPDYYEENDYLSNKIADVKTIGLTLSAQSIRFGFITDYHMAKNANNSPALLKKIMRETGIKTAFFNGDYTVGETTPLAGYEGLCEFLDYVAPLREVADAHYVTGNHEWNDPSASYTDRQIGRGALIQLFNAWDNNIVMLDEQTTNAFYLDMAAPKIRVYCLDLDYNTTLGLATRKKMFASLQEVPEGYAVLVVSHGGVSDTTSTALTSRFAQVMECCAALNDGTSVTFNLPSATTFNFTGKARTFIGALTGHTHVDGYYIYDSRFPVIVTECDAWNAQISGNTTRTAGNIEEQAFEIVQIDVAAKRIYLTRIGHGSDRVFSFGDSEAGLITA